EFLRGGASDRKLRLFACGCLRRVGRALDDPRDRHVIRVAELSADGAVGGRKRARAFLSAGWGYAATAHQRRPAPSPPGRPPPGPRPTSGTRARKRARLTAVATARWKTAQVPVRLRLMSLPWLVQSCLRSPTSL